ncbi:MAG TPA: PAS domain S-box protein, partial [Beijerinckiaceae bacterium]
VVTSWNIGAERSKGYRRDEIIGRHFSTFYTPEDRAAKLPERAIDVATREGRAEMQGWRVRKDGTRFWAHVIVDAIRDEDGRLLGFGKITRDLTAQREAEEALRRSEERFRLLVQGVTDYAIYMIDPTGVVTNWNAGAERIKQYTAQEIVGRNFASFYTDEDRASGLPQTALATAAAEGRYEKEGWRVRKDGTRFWAHVIIDRICDETGAILGFAKVTRDITERREAQERLEEARTALLQSQKMEAIGQLTGGVAHDFNNLLTVIVGGLDLLSRATRTPGERRLLDNMHKAAERGRTLTAQLLAFARRQPLKPQWHRPVELIRSFEPVLRRACGELVELRTRLSARGPAVFIDGPQFEAALLNLIVNARDAMPAGGSIQITSAPVTLDAREANRRGLEPGLYVRIQVADTGTGMSPEVLSRATEPFFTTKEVGKGTGLGLSQVFGFAAQSGGKLEIESVVGQGTSVAMLLPAAENGGLEGAEAQGEAAPSAGVVLIVEDEFDVREMAQQVFESLGYEVLLACDGAEALDILEHEPQVDVLFSDVVMPGGMSGAQLAHRVHEQRPEIRIVLASGYPMSTLADGLPPGAAFISKPYRWSELLEALRAERRA